MNKILIVMLSLALSTTTMAQTRRWVPKKATTNTTKTTSTTVKKKSSSRQKRTSSATRSTFTFGEIMATFPRLPIAIPIENQFKVLNQLKGYEWVVKSPCENKVEIFPRKVNYIYYPSHPQYRLIGDKLYDEKGNLKAVMLLYAWNHISMGTYLEDKYDEVFESSGSVERDELVKDLTISAYKNNAYNVNTAANENAKKEIEGLLGLTDYQSPYRNVTEGFSTEYQQAMDYRDQIKTDCENKVRLILKIERVDSTSFNVHYATEDKKPTIVVKYTFYSNGPYKIRYRHSFEGMVVDEPTKPSTSKPSISTESSQQTNKYNTIVYDEVDDMPQFPGGLSGLSEYLSSNIKYPVVAAENEVQGKVNVEFVVEPDGSISDVKVVKSVDKSLDKEAVRVVKSMPKWKPGKFKGEFVRVRYTAPVTFRLQ